MNYKELCKLSDSYIRSPKSHVKAYGHGLKDIRQIYENYTKFRLSEEDLLSSIAQDYIKTELATYGHSHASERHDAKEDLSYRIKAASLLVNKSQYSYDKTYDLLQDLEVGSSLEQAKDFIMLHPDYTKINKDTFTQVYKDIKKSWRKEEND